MNKYFIGIVLALVVFVFSGCQSQVQTPTTQSQISGDVAIEWFSLQLKLIKETAGFSPPVASRALGYSGVTLYESVVMGMPGYESLVGQLNDLTSIPQPSSEQVYQWGSVANSALAAITRLLYPTASPENLAAIDALETKFTEQYQLTASEDSINSSIAFGQAVAEAVFEWSKSDGGHEGYMPGTMDYLAPEGEGLWIPTPPKYANPLLPHWGENRPFAVKSSEHCSVPPPIEFSQSVTSEFYQQGMEVYTTVKNLTEEQKEIALFWADDAGKTFTPPGHSISIATQVLVKDDASLALAAETYAKVGLAVADSFIGCWGAKYTHNVLRPITYIQLTIDPAWNTPDIIDPVITPPFPEYTSGHSVQSAAAATVMTEIFGEDYRFTDSTHVENGFAARTYNSFHEAAMEASISRLYGGIHYRFSIEKGIEQGQCIGENVNNLTWQTISTAEK